MTTEHTETTMETLKLQAIARRVKALREELEMSQEALAREAGVSISTVQRVERCEKVSNGNYAEIATTLGQKVDYFDKLDPLEDVQAEIDLNDPLWKGAVELARQNGVRVLPMVEVESPMLLETLLDTEVSSIRVVTKDPECREEVLDLIAQIQQSHYDFKLLGSDLEPFQRRESIKDLWADITALQTLGYRCGVVVDPKRKFKNHYLPDAPPIIWDVGFLVLHQCEKLPKIFSYRPSEMKIGF